MSVFPSDKDSNCSNNFQSKADGLLQSAVPLSDADFHSGYDGDSPVGYEVLVDESPREALYSKYLECCDDDLEAHVPLLHDVEEDEDEPLLPVVPPRPVYNTPQNSLNALQMLMDENTDVTPVLPLDSAVQLFMAENLDETPVLPFWSPVQVMMESNFDTTPVLPAEKVGFHDDLSDDEEYLDLTIPNVSARSNGFYVSGTFEFSNTADNSITPVHIRRILIDTGAAVSLVSESVLKQSDVFPDYHSVEDLLGVRRLYSAEGRPMEFSGAITFSLQLDQTSTPLEFSAIVVPHLHEDFLLGADVLVKYGIILNMSNCTLSWSGSSTPLVPYIPRRTVEPQSPVQDTADTLHELVHFPRRTVEPQSPVQGSDVILNELVSIPARSEVIAIGRIACSYSTGLVERMPSPNCSSVLVGSTLVKSSVAGEVPVRLLNPSDSPIVLREHHPIATWHGMESFSFAELDDFSPTGSPVEGAANPSTSATVSSEERTFSPRNETPDSVISNSEVHFHGTRPPDFNDCTPFAVIAVGNVGAVDRLFHGTRPPENNYHSSAPLCDGIHSDHTVKCLELVFHGTRPPEYSP